MLIRSQDKEILVAFENLLNIEVSGGAISTRVDNGWSCLLGEYSTKAKAIKILDMIQEAYMNSEALKITSAGLTAATYAGSYDAPESAAAGIKVLKGYVKTIRESVVFQMTEDSEVEA